MAGPERTAIPKLTKPATTEALRHLPLDPTDGFVLSRVDGERTVDEIAAGTGLPVDQVLASLGKMASLGLLSGVDAPPPDDDDGVELEPAHRERIVAAHATLHEVDLYALLGVGRDADKKAVKRAYFELAGVFHPDRFFRKNPGPYKAKMEAVFARVTEAHDILTHTDKRAQYDAYLRDVAVTRTYEDVPPKPEPASAPLDAEPARQPGASSTPPMSVSPAPVSVPPDARARRDSLARRLLGGRSITPPGSGPVSRGPSSKPAAPASSPSIRDSSDSLTPPRSHDPLRQRYEAQLAAVRRDHQLRAQLAETYRRQAS